MSLTLKQYIDWVADGTLDAKGVISSYMKKLDAHKGGETNAVISLTEDYVANRIDETITKKLHGAPLFVKDNILIEGVRTTCGSKMLDEYIAPYTATCWNNLSDAWALVVAKANMDEFAIGSSNEYSAYGPAKNIYGNNKITGGTSGGSAVAVAADLCLAALGTDTGGSVRQPAFMCHIVGLKPTYGRVSRYGVQAQASSFDQVWVLTKTVEDAAILLDVIAGQDDKDATSVAKDDHASWFSALEKKDLKWIKIAVLNEFFTEWVDPLIEQQTRAMIAKAESLGATIEYMDFPLLQYIVPTYYILTPAEVSTNLARFDGIRYGLQDDPSAFSSIQDYYAHIRDKWFGPEVKRRILVGTYVLSAGYYDAYYRKAQQVRKKIKMAFDKLFESYDIVLGPTSPELAWTINERIDDPLKNYLADIYTIPASLGGYPAINIPSGLVEKDGEQFGTWVQLMAQQRREDKLFHIGNLLANKS